METECTILGGELPDELIQSFSKNNQSTGCSYVTNNFPVKWNNDNNPEADGLQQQKTTPGAAPVS